MQAPATRTHEEHAQAQREYYATHVRNGMLPKPTPYTLRHLNELLGHGAFAPGARLIDVGCGMGRFSFLLSERGYSVDALDVSQFMIDRLREFDGGRHNVRAWCSDLAEAPQQLHGQFDGVVGFFMLHHFSQLDPIFPAVRKLLKPGGRAVFVEPNPLNPLYYVQILSRPDMKWDAEKGMLNLRRKPVFQHMETAGLVDPQLVRYGFFPPFMRNTSWGGPVEGVIERIPGIKPVLPFQIFSLQEAGMTASAAPAPSKPSFTPERLQRLLDMNQRHFWFTGRRMLVDRLLRLYRTGDRVLDLGTGAGAAAERLGNEGLKVTAVDFLPHGLSRLRRAGAKVALVQSSAEALSLSADAFDAVLLLDVIEHLDDEAVLREAHRILRPGGAVFITVPAFAWLWSYRDDAAGHRRRYSRDGLTATIREAGFRVAHVSYYQCLLFPLAMLTRYAGRNSSALRDTEDMPPGWINTLFTAVNKAEVSLGRFVKWPWGSSLAAVGIKA